MMVLCLFFLWGTISASTAAEIQVSQQSILQSLRNRITQVKQLNTQLELARKRHESLQGKLAAVYQKKADRLTRILKSAQASATTQEVVTLFASARESLKKQLEPLQGALAVVDEASRIVGV